MRSFKLIFLFLIIEIAFDFLFKTAEAFPSADSDVNVRKEINELTRRLINKHLHTKIDEKRVEEYKATMQMDGSFPGIDYKTVFPNFPAGIHLKKLQAMAIAYRQPGNKYTGSSALLEKIQLGLDYWLRMQPTSKNWWFNDIGAPQDYMVIVILLKDKIAKNKLLHYSSYLQDKTGNKAHRGKNRTWVSDVTIHKGCIEENINLINIGFESIASTIKIVAKQGDEGIKIDGSFHQHRPQIYSGGYGMSIMDDLAAYIKLSEGTSFARLFTPEKKKIIADVLLQGHRLLGYKQTFDFGTVGRNITRKNGVNNLSVSTLELMKINDPQNASAYQAWIEHIQGKPFPEPGNKYFWKSNIMTQHGPNYYMSAKIVSDRSVGTECINNENFKGYNLPLGATNIVVIGKEYKNIYPLWDWTRIPGTTAVQNQDSTFLPGYLFGTNEFGGGVSNGKNGVIAYENDYKNLKAKKAYFFLDDVMICLGTGIEALAPDKVVTSVNQCFLEGAVTVNEHNKIKTYTSHVEIKNPVWVYHDRVGYLFPQGGDITLSVQKQSGAWKDINIDGDEKTEQGDIFNIWFNHGRKPTNKDYYYVVVPDKSLTDFQSFVKENTFRVIKNTTQVQAIENTRKGEYAIIFYEPGSVEIHSGFTLKTDKKCIIYMEKAGNSYEIAVSDPLYKQESVNLTLNGKNIPVTFPSGAYTGSTVQTFVSF